MTLNLDGSTRKNHRLRSDHPNSVLAVEDFEEWGAWVFETPLWKPIFAAGTGITPSTINKYSQGVLAIPQHVALILGMLCTLRENDLPLPPAFPTASERRQRGRPPKAITQ